MKLIGPTVIGACAAAGLGLAASGEDLAGSTWTTEGGGARVTFADEADGLVGRVAWLRRQQESGETVLDTNNADVAQQSRELMGSVMVWGFERTGDAEWDRGKIYAPDDGKTYNARMELDGDALTVTGCIRWPLCRDQTWTRAAAE